MVSLPPRQTAATAPVNKLLSVFLKTEVCPSFMAGMLKEHCLYVFVIGAQSVIA